jgi:hypothetical protein
MAKNPKHRHQNASEFANALETVIQAVGITDSNNSRSPSQVSPAKIPTKNQQPVRDGISTVPFPEEILKANQSKSPASTVVLEPGFEASFSEIILPGQDGGAIPAGFPADAGG